MFERIISSENSTKLSSILEFSNPSKKIIVRPLDWFITFVETKDNGIIKSTKNLFFSKH